jgi:hypothetical protein
MNRPRPPDVRLHRRRCDGVVYLRQVQSNVRETKRADRPDARAYFIHRRAELTGAIGIVFTHGGRGRSVAQRMGSRWTCNGHPVGNWLPHATPGVAGYAGHSLCGRCFCGVRAFFSMEVNKGQMLPPPVLSASGSRGRA